MAIVLWLRNIIVPLCDEWPSPGLLHHSVRALNVGCRVLERAGVFTAEGPYWGYSGGGADLRELPVHFDRRIVDMAVFAFVQVSALRGSAPTRHAASEPEDMLQARAFEAMVRCSYMKLTSGNTYQWTPAAGPWLVAAEERDLLEYEVASSEDVSRALSLIPEPNLRWLESNNYAPSFARNFFQGWFGNQWHSDDCREFPSDDTDLPLAVALYVHLH